MRVRLKNDNSPKAIRLISLPEGLFDPAACDVHKKIIELRDRAIAHSDFDLKPTARVPRNDTGVMTWSKPFNPLSEGISIPFFQTMAWRLFNHCFHEMKQLNSQMNGAPDPTGSPQLSGDSVSIISIPLSDFIPKAER